MKIKNNKIIFLAIIILLTIGGAITYYISCYSGENRDIININIEDYVGTWYEDESSVGYSNVIIEQDENKNISIEIGIYRTCAFDDLDFSIKNNIITFYNNDYFSGTLTLEKNKIILNYSFNDFSEIINFNYKK